MIRTAWLFIFGLNLGFIMVTITEAIVTRRWKAWDGLWIPCWSAFAAISLGFAVSAPWLG